MTPPRVSVVVPCFESAATLEQTLASVRAQTMQAFEIVLVDDGSGPDTRAAIRALERAWHEPRLRIVWQANGGTAAARNAGIAAARAPYVLPLDADDLIAPAMLERCLAAIEASPAVDLVYTDREDFGERHGVHVAGTYALERLKWFNQIGYCTLYRRALWQAIGGYRTNVSGFDDWDFWIAAAARGATARHLREPLFRHRRHAGSQLGRLLPQFERLHARIVLNRAEAYAPHEVAAARAFVEGGPVPGVLRAARFVFMARWNADGASRRHSAEPACG